MSLRFTILGCGSSAGVPRPALGWGACDPNNPKNRRRRTSLLVERHGRQIAVLVQVELAVAHAGDERAPLAGGVPVDRPMAVVLGVPDHDHPVVVGYFDATTAVRAAERALTPARVI